MKKNIFFIVLIISVLVAFASYSFFGKKTDFVSYKTFYQEVEDNKISTVSIASDKISFKYIGGESLFQTENPQSPNLKEYLLLHDVKVTEEKDGAEVFSMIFDILFYIIFFGSILIIFRKFISPNTFKSIRKTGIKFENIVGMEDLKKDMLQIAKLMKNPALCQKERIRLPKGILLEGEPGNGKTLFARALAGEADVNFIPAKATDFESMFMAIGPAKVKLLFAKARRKAPCIVFIDEFDGIGTRRNYSGSAIETENTRIVTALLNELDGFTPNKGILVLAATNSRQALDPALIRPGRFDAKYTVPAPDQESRIKLIEMYSRDKKFADTIKIEELARQFNGESCAHIESVINTAALNARQNNRSEINEEDIKNALHKN
ncbi:MAG: ATP-dependent metallopeptidase FtsH/Yme1/Tma family protein [Treponema sp.]|nr:ATP-dependent metallopeptidase FtsH/Yme1/Tma family protein [Treponema sp.]